MWVFYSPRIQAFVLERIDLLQRLCYSEWYAAHAEWRQPAIIQASSWYCGPRGKNLNVEEIILKDQWKKLFIIIIILIFTFQTAANKKKIENYICPVSCLCTRGLFCAMSDTFKTASFCSLFFFHIQKSSWEQSDWIAASQTLVSDFHKYFQLKSYIYLLLITNEIRKVWQNTCVISLILWNDERLGNTYFWSLYGRFIPAWRLYTSSVLYFFYFKTFIQQWLVF